MDKVASRIRLQLLPNFATIIKVRANEKDYIIAYRCLDVQH